MAYEPVYGNWIWDRRLHVRPLVSVLLDSNDDTVDYDFTDNSRPSLICGKLYNESYTSPLMDWFAVNEITVMLSMSIKDVDTSESCHVTGCCAHAARRCRDSAQRDPPRH